MKKDGLPEIARKIYEETQRDISFAATILSGSVGRRYLRAAEEGTPYCITVDYQTKEDGTVTLRDRDTESQVRVHKDEVTQKVRDLLKGKISFSEAGAPVEKISR